MSGVTTDIERQMQEAVGAWIEAHLGEQAAVGALEKHASFLPPGNPYASESRPAVYFQVRAGEYAEEDAISLLRQELRGVRMADVHIQYDAREKSYGVFIPSNKLSADGIVPFVRASTHQEVNHQLWR